MIAPPRRWAIPPGLWSVLAVLAIGVVAVFALGAWWTDRRFAHLEREQNRELCGVLRIIVTGPEPPAGPDGERARQVRDGLVRWRADLGCREG